MPNQTDPTQNQTDSVLTPPVMMPIQADLPPMPNFPSTTSTTTTNTTSQNSNFFPPGVPSSPKKRFGGKQIIATFLGVLLLIAGITTGIVLVRQPQLLNQKATPAVWIISECAASDVIGCDNTAIPVVEVHGYYVNGHWINTGANGPSAKDPIANNLEVNDLSGNINNDIVLSNGVVLNGDGVTQTTSVILPDLNSCTGTEPCHAGGVTGTCINGACVSSNTSCKTGDIGAPGCCASTSCSNLVCEGGQLGSRLECKLPTGQHCTIEVNSPYCGNTIPTDNSSTPPSVPTPVPPTPSPAPLCNSVCTTTSQCLTGQTCSIASGQTSGNCRNPSCTAQADCLCPTPSPSPSPTPGPTAQCSGVKAYDSAFTELSQAQLSGLKAGNNIEFCVAGTASSGAFDMAKFTINGVVQAETTTKRPGSNDFCQEYTIPAGVFAFDVTAQIHHVVLGYVGP